MKSGSGLVMVIWPDSSGICSSIPSISCNVAETRLFMVISQFPLLVQADNLLSTRLARAKEHHCEAGPFGLPIRLSFLSMPRRFV
jgi:hypothetical protein